MVCDLENSDSVVHHVWNGLAEKILDLDRRHPEIWKMNDRKMDMWVKPTQLLEQLRCIFWSNIYECRALNIKVKKEDIIFGLMDDDFFKSITDVDANLAYFIRPIPRVEAAFEALLWRGLKRAIEVMDMGWEDLKSQPYNGRRNYLSMVFQVIKECENRLMRRSYGQADINKSRRKLAKELSEEGSNLNVSTPGPLPQDLDVSGFDLSDIPDTGVFEEEEEIGSN